MRFYFWDNAKLREMVTYVRNNIAAYNIVIQMICTNVVNKLLFPFILVDVTLDLKQKSNSVLALQFRHKLQVLSYF